MEQNRESRNRHIEKQSTIFEKKKQGQSSWAKIISLTNGIETKGNPLEIRFKKINPDT